MGTDDVFVYSSESQQKDDLLFFSWSLNFNLFYSIQDFWTVAELRGILLRISL